MDAITSHTSRQRQRSRIATQTISSHDPLNETWSLKGGLIGTTVFVDEFSYPREVNVNDAIDLKFTILNNNYVNDGSDSCRDGAINPGSQVEASATIQGDSASETYCVPNIKSPIGGSGRKEATLTLQAPPTPGTYEMEVTFLTTETNQGGTQTFEVAVLEEGTGGDGREEGDPIDGGPITNPDESSNPFAGLFGDSALTAGFAGGLGLVVLLFILLGGE